MANKAERIPYTIQNIDKIFCAFLLSPMISLLPYIPMVIMLLFTVEVRRAAYMIMLPPYIAAFILGVPMFLVLNYLNWNFSLVYKILGGVIGAAAFPLTAIVDRLTGGALHDWTELHWPFFHWPFMFMGTVHGVIAGAIFYRKVFRVDTEMKEIA